MSRWARALALLGVALSAGSCAAPPDARFAEYAAIPPGRARLYVYRPTHSAGPRDSGAITLDARPLAALDRGEYVTVALPPGSHELRAGVSEVSRLAALPPRAIELTADRATFCSLSAESAALMVVWDLRCSGDPAAHAELRDCRHGKLDRTVDWEP